jgi:hypothetical protein
MSKTKYTVTIEGATFTRNSKRDDFKFAVVYKCSMRGWLLAGLRTNRDDAEKLRGWHDANLESVIIAL